MSDLVKAYREIERLRAALEEIIEWSDGYKHDDGTYETDRGDPGDMARKALNPDD